MWTPIVIIALLFALLPVSATGAEGSELPTIATEVQSDLEPIGTYWRRNREGWFWYQDPREATIRPNKVPAIPDRPRELAEFESLQKRLEDLKRVAVMNPTDSNLLAYMRYQRFVMNKSEFFAERWQRLVWSVPELDYGLTGRPTNAMAITAFDEQQRERAAQRVRSLAATHGLIFIFRSDCPYCHRFAPILKRFEETFGMTVLAVSLDGQGLPEYPNAQRDNGIAARLESTVVPALYLSAPSKREVRPIGFGVMAMTDLIERIAALADGNRDAPL